MYIVSNFKNGNLSVPDAVVCNSIKELREARDKGCFKRLFYPDCFFVDANSGLLAKLSADFLKENVWKNEMIKRL